MMIPTIQDRLEAYLLVKLSYETLLEGLVAHLKWELVESSSQPAPALAHLAQFTQPTTQFSVFGIGNDWSVLLNNAPYASVSDAPEIGSQLHCEVFSVLNRAGRVWKQGAKSITLVDEGRHVLYYQASSIVSASRQRNLSTVHPDIAAGRKYGEAKFPTANPQVWLVDDFGEHELEDFLLEKGGFFVQARDFEQAERFALLHHPQKLMVTARGTLAERDNPAWDLFFQAQTWYERRATRPNWYNQVLTYLEEALSLDSSLQAQVQPYLDSAHAAQQQAE